MRIEVGNHAYVRATIQENPEAGQLVCPTKTAFTEMMEDGPANCKSEPVGSLVTIHKLRQDPGVFGGDAFYVIASHWSGLISDDDIVPIVPKGIVIQCGGADGDDKERMLYDGRYQEASNLGVGAFRAIVRHSLEPEETLGPAVHILSGREAGRDGYLLFTDIDHDCVIAGTKFHPDFDWISYERGQ